jgi:hypothetical protein
MSSRLLDKKYTFRVRGPFGKKLLTQSITPVSLTFYLVMMYTLLLSGRE